MTFEAKLDKILNGLLSRIPQRLSADLDDKRLTFAFLCDTLFAKEGHEIWETQHLENRLINDGYITYKQFGDALLPEITQEGQKFIQSGGYIHQKKMKFTSEELTKQLLRNANKNWITIVIATAALIISILSYFK